MTQVKAFGLLVAILWIVDAAAWHGHYRHEAALELRVAADHVSRLNW